MIINKPASHHLRTYREAIGWTILHLAGKLRVDRRTIRRWENGETNPNPRDIAWLERLARFHADNPPPVREK